MGSESRKRGCFSLTSSHPIHKLHPRIRISPTRRRRRLVSGHVDRFDESTPIRPRWTMYAAASFPSRAHRHAHGSHLDTAFVVELLRTACIPSEMASCSPDDVRYWTTPTSLAKHDTLGFTTGSLSSPPCHTYLLATCWPPWDWDTEHSLVLCTGNMQHMQPADPTWLVARASPLMPCFGPRRTPRLVLDRHTPSTRSLSSSRGQWTFS